MGALTPQFLMDLESRMSIISEREYSRLSSNLWWQMLTKVRPSNGRREVITWLLSTAMIRDEGKGGNIAFDDLVSTYTEFENKWSGAALQIRRDLLEDVDGGGMDLAAQWSGDIGAYMSYWPQKQVTDVLKNGHTLATAAGGYTGYDGKAFFATDHPVNPFNTSAGVYANLLTGGASGAYPGALPLDVSVTPDAALTNLGKLMSYVATFKMPNGVDPRFLRPKGLLCAPALYPRLVQLTNAKFLAQVAGSSAASGDVEAVIKALGYAQPVMADELAGFESDTTYYVICEQLATSQLGAVIYSEREPYKINYYGVMDIAELNRMDMLEWHCKGRNAVSTGHPYLLIKCKGA
jgi:hypothetical protein